MTGPGLPSEPGYPSSEPLGLPSIEELTVEPPSPGRSPSELSAIMMHSMGWPTRRPGSLTRTAQMSVRSARSLACEPGLGRRESLRKQRRPPGQPGKGIGPY
jgi:hypothetical protein